VTPTGETSDSGASDDIARAIAGMRGTLKWLLGGFTAIGAALIAGLSLSSLGEHDRNTALAVAGFGLAIVGLLVAGVLAGWVLSDHRLITLETLQVDPAFKALMDDVATYPSVQAAAGRPVQIGRAVGNQTPLLTALAGC
jgi:hypothetical protein